MIRLTFLGTGAAVPSVERNVSAMMLEREGVPLLFDCGEGTQRQMMRYAVGFTVADLFLTHYHADHTLGLPGLLRTMGLQDRTAAFTVYGPPDAERHIRPLIDLGMERPKFPVEVRELRPGDVLERGDHILEVGEASHKGAALCYALVEKPRLGRFDPERAELLGIPEGPLRGRIHRGESITLENGQTVHPQDLVGPTRPGRRVVLSGDTAPSAAVRRLAKGADLLVHEATFSEEDRVRARETRHSTARQAAEVARDAGVKELVLTHLSARYSREAPELLKEAQEVFPACRIARDGLCVEVPFHD